MRRRKSCGRNTRSNIADFGTKSSPRRSDGMRILVLLPKILLGGLVLFAIGTMLWGVLMRYVMLPITDWLDVDPFNFFWVEELGETTLAWLTLIGAAIAVKERSHFALSLVTHRWSPPARA